MEWISTEGCSALVNCIGIKRNWGANTFRMAHVVRCGTVRMVELVCVHHSKQSTHHTLMTLLVLRLLVLAKMANIPHFLHISVIAAQRNDDNCEGYIHTKWEGEEVLRSAQLNGSIGAELFFSCDCGHVAMDAFCCRVELTVQLHVNVHFQLPTTAQVSIIRPSVIFGEGDDTIRNLVRSIKHMPPFPLINGGKCRHNPVFVGDVAEHVLQVVNQEEMNAILFFLLLFYSWETLSVSTSAPNSYLRLHAWPLNTHIQHDAISTGHPFSPLS